MKGAPEQGAMGVCTQDSLALRWEGVSDSCEVETQITFTFWTSVGTAFSHLLGVQMRGRRNACIFLIIYVECHFSFKVRC